MQRSLDIAQVSIRERGMQTRRLEPKHHPERASGVVTFTVLGTRSHLVREAQEPLLRKGNQVKVERTYVVQLLGTGGLEWDIGGLGQYSRTEGFLSKTYAYTGQQ